MPQSDKAQLAAYITPKALAEELGISVKTLANWRVLRQGPRWAKLGRGRCAKVVYVRRDVDGWLKSMTIPALGTTRRKQ